MKKFLLFWSVAALLLGSACSKTETAEPAGSASGETERIYLGAETATRAGFTGDGYKIAWTEGDMVSVNATKAGGSRNECPLKRDEQGAWYIEAPQAAVYHVVYPAIAGYEATDGSGAIIGNHVYLNDRDYQIYHPGTFDPARLVCFGTVLPKQKLTLRYMVALLKLTFRGAATDRVTAVTVTGGNNENIFASIGVCQPGPDGFPELTAGEGPYKSQTLRVEQSGGVALNSQGVDFYLALFPMTLSKGFTVQVDFADGTSRSVTASKSVELKRGRILAMPAIELELPAPLLYSYDQTAWEPWRNEANGIPQVLPDLNTTNRIIYLKDNPESSEAGITRAHLQSIADKFRKDAATEETFSLYMNTATLAGTTEFPSDIFCGFCWNGTIVSSTRDYALKTIMFPANMTRIADASVGPNGTATSLTGAFCRNDGLKLVGIQGATNHIGTGAFSFCTTLETVLISGSAEPLTIERYVFRSATSLNTVHIARTTPPKLVFDESGHSPFYGAGTSGIVFRVPAASLAAYSADPSWQKVIAEGTNRTWGTY